MRIEVDTLKSEKTHVRPMGLKKLKINPSEKKMNSRSESV